MNNDVKILRKLASEYFSIANSDKNKQNIMAHKNVNDLKGKRPIVLIDEIPWHEMNINDELTIKCTHPYLKQIEGFFRTNIYKWHHMPADMVLTPYFGVQKVINSTGNGLTRQFNDDGAQSKEGILAHTYIDQIKTIEDVELLHNEIITYDREATFKLYELAANIFGDIMPVKVVGEYSGYGCACKIWDEISNYKSIDSILYALVDEPELMHALAGKLADILIDKNNQYNKLGLFDADAYYNHCTAALTNDLTPDYAHVTSKDVWGRGLAQIFSTVSPQMHDEFDIAYQVRVLKDFGLVYYGCCEPLHNKIHIIEKIKNLRKISITPWADVDSAAEIIGRRYVLASKPNPSALTMKNINEDAIRDEIEKIVDACRRNDCSCDIVLKDITTVANVPENLFKWEKIAMEVVNNY